MLRNYFSIAFRNLLRHKVFSLINLVGLVIGMTSSFLIYLYVSHELSYDTYHTKADRIYRLLMYDDRPSESRFSSPSPAIGATMLREYPEIEALTRVNFRSALVISGKNKIQEDNIMFADSSLTTTFSFPFIKGDPHLALTQPFTVILSETASKKYFGKADPLGQTIKFDRNQYESFNAIVTGVIKDIPENSHFRSDIIVSLVTLTQKLEPEMEDCWDCPRGPVYLLLTDKNNRDALQSKLPSFLKKNEGKFITEERGHVTLSLEPLKDIYLHGKYPSQQSGNMYNVYIFSVIAVFIMLIACVNFVNLTTARSAERAKEVGIRKVIGSSRNQLIWQFIGESLLLSLFAFFLSCLFCGMLIPRFNDLSGKVISQGILEHPDSILSLFGITILIGLSAGIYPAFVLSAFKPVAVLKGHFTTGKKGIRLREILVVAQFAVSIILIIGTIVIYSQLNYIRDQPLGFKKNQMLVINFQSDPLVKEKLETVKLELTKIPNVFSASASSGIPNSGFEDAHYAIVNKSGELQEVRIPLYMVDEDFFDQYQIGLVAGRKFSKQFPTDFKSALVVNESALKKLGYTSAADIIGKRFVGEGEGTVIGVVKDFHFRSLHEPIEPLIFRTFFLATKYLTLSIGARNTSSTIGAIKTRWDQLAPQRPFSYFFLDEAIDKQYRSEVTFGRLFLYFGIFAIFISGLGLFGLTLFTTFQRTKEIGIRKVLGASVLSIVNLLSANFLKLVVIAFVIASPIASLAMNQWLQGFAYRIDIGAWIFLAGGLAAILIALFTVSFHAVKAAVANPVTSLRSE